MSWVTTLTAPTFRAGLSLKNVWLAAVMRRALTKQTIKIRRLAFVLALALLWYGLNPAPSPFILKKREAEPLDEKKRNLEPQSMPVTLLAAFRTIWEINLYHLLMKMLTT